MANGMDTGGTRSWHPWRILGWGTAAALLLTPLVAMQFTSEVNWTPSDFAFAAIMFGGVGIIYEFTVRRTNSHFYRGGVALALAAAFLIVWANGAVGMIGDEGNPANLMFAAVLAIALIGSVLARFRARGMAVDMFASAVVQAVAGGLGMLIDPLGGILSAAFAGLWLVSAALFRAAAGDCRA
jgi:hypothetical protein